MRSHTVAMPEGSFIAITEGLRDVLLQLRHRKDMRTLWIDQLCVNQDNNDEKSHQVSLMAEIFRGALRVIIWLGKEADQSSETVDRIAELVDQIKDSGRSRPPILDAELAPRSPAWIAIAKLLHRPWFSRLWTLQEAALAAKCDVLCGAKEISLSLISGLGFDFGLEEKRYWTEIALSIHHAASFNATNERFITDHRMACIARLRGSKFLSASNLLDMLRYDQASVSKDRVYALYDFLPAALIKRVGHPNYCSEYSDTQLFQTVATVALTKMACLAFLCAAGRAKQRHGFGAPSWVADWACRKEYAALWTLDKDMELWGAGRLYRAGLVPSPCLAETRPGGALIVDGKIIDSIDEFSASFSFQTQPYVFEKMFHEMNGYQSFARKHLKELRVCLDLFKRLSSISDLAASEGACLDTLVAGIKYHTGFESAALKRCSTDEVTNTLKVLHRISRDGVSENIADLRRPQWLDSEGFLRPQTIRADLGPDERTSISVGAADKYLGGSSGALRHVSVAQRQANSCRGAGFLCHKERSPWLRTGSGARPAKADPRDGDLAERGSTCCNRWLLNAFRSAPDPIRSGGV